MKLGTGTAFHRCKRCGFQVLHLLLVDDQATPQSGQVRTGAAPVDPAGPDPAPLWTGTECPKARPQGKKDHPNVSLCLIIQYK